MSLESMLGWVLRASGVLALALSVLPVLRAASASVRRGVLLLGLVGALLVPPLALSFPERPTVHVDAPALVGHVVAEALSPSVVAAPSRGAPRAPATRAPWDPARVLSSIWALGALFVAARAVLGGIGAWRLSSSATPGNGSVRVSAGIEAPVVVGVLRPIVLLPPSSVRWSEERRRAVLLHELAHVRKLDGLALLLAQLVCAMYWFQPLAWLAKRRLRRECELTADEAVIASGLLPSCYAQHLLEIARGLVPAVGIAMAARPSELARRIQVLVARDRLPTPLTRPRALLLVLAALIVLGSVACMDAGTNSARVAPRGGQPGAAGTRAAGPGLAVPVKAIDARLQAITDEEAQRVRVEWGAERVAMLVLDPHSGALLAESDDAPSQPVVPASTLKPLTVATALDAELITTSQRFDCGNGTRSYGSLTLRDAGEYGTLDTAEILAVSSNIGVSRIFDVLGGERLAEGLRRFRVGAPASIPSGTLQGAIVANGEGSTTTPAALAAAYGVFANDGLLASANGAAPERVIKPATAKAVRAMLEGVVTGERATGKAAAVSGARVGGKTGTSDDPDCTSCAQGGGPFLSFVGIVPIDSPRWVIYVGVGKPKKAGTGGSVAAPAFSRVATRALAL